MVLELQPKNHDQVWLGQVSKVRLGQLDQVRLGQVSQVRLVSLGFVKLGYVILGRVTQFGGERQTPPQIWFPKRSVMLVKLRQVTYWVISGQVWLVFSTITREPYIRRVADKNGFHHRDPEKISNPIGHGCFGSEMTKKYFL